MYYRGKKKKKIKKPTNKVCVDCSTEKALFRTLGLKLMFTMNISIMVSFNHLYASLPYTTKVLPPSMPPRLSR